MDDQQMEAIRQNIERYEENLREHRQELRRDFKRHADLEDSISAARRFVPLGMIPAALVTLRFAYVAGFWSIPFLFAGFCLMGLTGYFAPYVGAFAANYWFYNSGVSSRRAAIVLMLLIEVSLAGWMFLIYGRMESSLVRW